MPDPHLQLKSMNPQLLVTDLDRSVAFYTGVLGFEVWFRYEDFYVGIRKDGFSMHLKAGQPSPEERNNRRINEHVDLIFAVANIEEAYEALIQSEAEIIQPLRQVPYGKEFYFSDPDGYIIAFTEES